MSTLRFIKPLFKSMAFVLIALGISFPVLGKTGKQTQGKNKYPDFAYPATVSDKAEETLSNALENKDFESALNSVIELTLAKNLISHANVGAQARLLDSLARISPSPYQNLFYLLEANLLVDIYNSESWKFTQRNLPLDVYPEKFDDWSKDLFAIKVMELVQKAVPCSDGYIDMPVSALGKAIEVPNGCDVASYVSQFICFKSNSLLKPFGTETVATIPFGFKNNTIKLSVGTRINDMRMRILEILIDLPYTHKDPASKCMALVEKSQLVSADDRKQFLMKSYVENRASVYSGILLEKIFDLISPRRDATEVSDEEKQYYIQASEYLKTFENKEEASGVKNILSRIKAKNIRFEFKGQYLSSDTIRTEIKARNAGDFYLLVYKLPETYARGTKVQNVIAKGQIVKTVRVSMPGMVPYCAWSAVDMGFLPYGLYAVLPSTTTTSSGVFASVKRTDYVDIFRVSDIATINVNDACGKNKSGIYVVDGKNQKPIVGIKVKFTPSYGKNGIPVVRATDKNGFAEGVEKNCNIEIRRGKDVYFSDYYGYSRDNDNKIIRQYARILTDLSIFHPGDSVGFAVITYSCAEREYKVEKNRKVKAVLKDANYNNVEEIELVTDQNGRAASSFLLPKTGLLGRWNIVVSNVGEDNEIIGTSWFDVADYKMPTFYVSVDSVVNKASSDGKVRILGRAETYSGMPVSDAEVNFNVRYVSWWLWRGVSSPNAAFAGVTKTGPDGRFEIELSTEGLKNSAYCYGAYQLSVSATSKAGETQEAPSKNFALGMAESIVPGLPEYCNADLSEQRFIVHVNDIFGKHISRKVNYKIIGKSGRIIMGGDFVSPDFAVDLNKLASGSYTFSFSLADNDSVKTSADMIVFRTDEKRPPVKTILWTDIDKITASPDAREIKVRFGSSYNDSWVLCQIASSDSIHDVKWIRMNDEIIGIKVPVPAANERIRVILTAMHDLKGMQRIIEVIPHSQSEKLDILVESFRDKVLSGEKEQWTFKFLYAGKSVEFIPSLAVMTDKSLNAIAPFSWNFSPADGVYYPTPVNTYIYRNSNCGYYFNLSSYKYVKQRYSTLPEWNLYDYNSLYPVRMSNRYRVRGLSNGKEVAMNEELAENIVLYAAAPAMKKTAMFDSFEEAADDSVTGGVVTSDSSEAKDKMQLRNVEHPVAFFMPLLLSDKEGNVDLSFEVPNFNTTWQLQLLGYYDNMKTAKVTLDAVSSKPVMLSTNLPRFLRSGDRDMLNVSVFNNTDKTSDIDVSISACDPMTGTVINHKKVRVTLDGMKSGVVSVDMNVPDYVSIIDFKAIAVSGNYSDGERAEIVILPASSPVVESKPFYIGKNMSEFEIKLPEYDKDARLTFQYCNNPVWYAVMALPSVFNTQSRSLLTLMDAFYANTAAGAIVRKYPQVRETLASLVAAADRDSVLMSNLQKNDDLKIVSLNNTIWTGDASSESLRMLALSHLLTVAQNKATSDELLRKIKNMQNSDGGWGWCPDMKSSYYMTERALRIFSMLSQMGYLDCDKSLSDAIGNGLNYCDRYWTKQRRVHSTEMLEYLFIKSCLPKNNETAAFAKLRSASVRNIIADWRKFGIEEKSVAAMLLWKENYKSEARSILESLRQYAVTDAVGTMKYDNLISGYGGHKRIAVTASVLNAFAMIDPLSSSVDALRQFLIYQKETENWSNCPDNVGVVQSILASGSDWTLPCDMPVITLDGKSIQPVSADMATGYFKIKLPVEKSSGAILSVHKSCPAPAWGSVMSQYVEPIKDIQDYSIPDLSIRKKIYAVDDQTGATNLVKAPLKIGQKVRIVLNITAGKDMEYVAVTDERAAFLEPAEQLSHFTYSDDLGYYREVTDTKTNLFISFLPKGSHIITYDCYVAQEGEFSLGIATAQSQYAPQIAAHSSGQIVGIEK